MPTGELKYSVSVYERKDSPCWWARAYLKGEGGKDRRWNTGIAIGTNRRESRRDGQRAAEKQAGERLVAVHEADSGRSLAMVAARLIKQKVRDDRQDRAVTSLSWVLDKRVKPYFGDGRDVTTIRRADLESFKQHLLDKGLAPTSVNNALTGIRQVLKYAAEVEELIDAVPLIRNVRVDQEGKGRALSEDEIQALIANVWPTADEAREWIILLANTGLRRTESLSMLWSWIDWNECVLRVPAQYRKGRRRQAAPTPLNSAAMAMLEARRERLKASGDYDPVGRVWLQSDHDQARREAARRAGLGKVRSHDLRHTAGSRAWEAGASLPEVRDLLGHSTLAMVNRYAHSSGERLKSVAERIAVTGSVPGERHEISANDQERKDDLRISGDKK